jgi:gluconolactonase
MAKGLLKVLLGLAALTMAGTAEAEVRKIAGGFGFLEGPVWDAANSRLIFSDLRTRRIYQYVPGSEPVVLFDASHKANGNWVLADGRLLSCEHASHALAVRRPDGGRDVLVDSFEGRPLNSPNDLALKSDGTIWFTDPDYGLGGRPREQAHNHVFVLDPTTRALRPVVSDFDKPNGLCFSPDEKTVYIADSGRPRHIRAFDVTEDNRLVNGRVFAVISPPAPDGIRCDAEGNVWSSAGDGIHVFHPAGERVRVIPVPERPSNLCFGGANGQTLFITARTSLYAVEIQ